MAWYHRLRNILRRAQVDAEIEREFAFHVDERVDDLIASGMSQEEARRTARRQFGNHTLQKERTRDTDISFIGDAWRDLRHGVRQLRSSPAFSIVAVLALGIGVGANITIFGFINALLFRSLDAREPSRLVRVFGEGASTQTAKATNSEAYIPAQDYFQYRDRNQSFSDLAAQFIGGPSVVRVAGPPQMIPVMPVSANYFDTVGVPAAMGRTLIPQDGQRGAPDVIVLSDAGWRRFFNADVNVVGKAAVIDGVPKTIVGVTPSWFKGTNSPMIPQIYTPIIERPGPLPFRVWLIGRLKPGVSVSQARADLLRIAAQLTAQDQKRRPIEIYPATALMPFLLGTMSLFAAMFGIIVGVVLLIVCDNIAILILTRSVVRRREIAIRLALGASRSRLMVELLAESLLLCAGGGLVGIFTAYAAAQFLTQIYLPAPMPFALTFNLDWRVVVFTVGISFGGTLLCGLAPALQSLKTDAVTALKGSGSADVSRVRSGLIITQMTLSTTLLVTAVVLANSLMGPVSQNRGFISDGVLMSTIGIGRRDYTPQRRVAFLETLQERIDRAPGVSAVTIVDNIPLTNNNPINPTEMSSDRRVHKVYTNRVSRGLFQSLNIPFLAGRDFSFRDNATSPAVGIVNEALASRFWPGDNPIGKALQSADGSLIEVVGLARDSKYESIDEPPKAFLYRPMAQGPVPVPTFLIKTTGDPSAMFSLVRTLVAELDPDLVPYNLMTLDDRLGLALVVNRAAATISGTFGILALALGSIGIYGTISFLVQQRQREIGIRLALGASRSGVIKLITKQGMIWIATGLAFGLAGGFGSALLLSGLLYGVRVGDPLAFILTPLILGGTAYIACYFPASRASRLDPLIMLREE